MTSPPAAGKLITSLSEAVSVFTPLTKALGYWLHPDVLCKLLHHKFQLAESPMEE
jgi:hypothetical protein